MHGCPKLDPGQNYSWLNLFDVMYQEESRVSSPGVRIRPVASANANKVRQAMTKLDWLVNVNIFDNETGSFWQGPGMDPKKIKTEVFMLPCAASVEKEGSITNSGRWVQWRYKAVDPPGQAKPDGDIMVELMAKIKDLYKKKAGSSRSHPEPQMGLRGRKGNFDPHKMAKEINGYFLKDVTLKDPTGQDKQFKKGDLVPAFAFLQATAAPPAETGFTARATMQTATTWPDGRKMTPLASGSIPSGPGAGRSTGGSSTTALRSISMVNPCNPKRPLLKWDDGKWVGDVPDGPWPPMSDKEKGNYPFIMKPDGVASLFGPGLNDGPFPSTTNLWNARSQQSAFQTGDKSNHQDLCR